MLDLSCRNVYNLSKKGENAMSILDSFTAYNFNAGVPYISITSNGITFNKSVVIKLGHPKFVVLLIDENEKRIAIQACEESAKNAVAFYKEKKSNVVSVRWNGRDLLNTFQELMGWNLKESSGYRIDGVLLKEEHAMLFNLKEAHPLS